MKLVSQIHSYGFLVLYSCDMKMYELNFGAPNPSCFAYKQVNAQPY